MFQGTVNPIGFKQKLSIEEVQEVYVASMERGIKVLLGDTSLTLVPMEQGHVPMSVTRMVRLGPGSATQVQPCGNEVTKHNMREPSIVHCIGEHGIQLEGFCEGYQALSVFT
ncbi:MAG: hypothetical protein IPG74_17375 [Flavobacteriales bacterium]|nr:hypothetical protein [Flavobacteriales bacterium]